MATATIDQHTGAFVGDYIQIKYMINKMTRRKLFYPVLFCFCDIVVLDLFTI